MFYQHTGGCSTGSEALRNTVLFSPTAFIRLVHPSHHHHHQYEVQMKHTHDKVAQLTSPFLMRRTCRSSNPIARSTVSQFCHAQVFIIDDNDHKNSDDENFYPGVESRYACWFTWSSWPASRQQVPSWLPLLFFFPLVVIFISIFVARAQIQRFFCSPAKTKDIKEQLVLEVIFYQLRQQQFSIQINTLTTIRSTLCSNSI